MARKEFPRKLQQTLETVCDKGYVKFRGKWYRGIASMGKKLNCNACHFAGCQIEDAVKR